MNRGTVMEKGNHKAIVLTPDGEFVRVNVRRDVAVGEEISWPHADAMPTRSLLAAGSRRWMSYGVSAAAMLLLLFALWSMRTPTVVAYVSMDINPSVEFGLDAKERVRELRAVNQDAVPLLAGVAFKGKPIETVVQVLARKLAVSHLLNGGAGEIVIASVRLNSVDVKWETQVTDKIERVMQAANAGAGDTNTLTAALDIEKVYVPAEVREEATANGISSGKMAFWLAAGGKGYEVPLSALQEDSLKKVAFAWGGLKQVLPQEADQKYNEEKWKKLLAQQKEKKQKQNENRGNEGDDRQNGYQDEDKQHGQDKHHSTDEENNKPTDEEKNKPKNEGEKKSNKDDEDKNKSIRDHQDKNTPSNDDRHQSRNGDDRNGDKPKSGDRADDHESRRGDDNKSRNGDHSDSSHGGGYQDDNKQSGDDDKEQSQMQHNDN